MAVIVGSDGAVKIDLGNGSKYIANTLSWQCRLNRDMLRRTTQADEAEKRTAGLADWTGDFAFQMQFSDDTAIAQSSWQMLNFALSNTDDQLKAELVLILQRNQILPDYNIFNTSVQGVVKLTGMVVIGNVSLNCQDPEQPLALVAEWSADGVLVLQRG